MRTPDSGLRADRLLEERLELWIAAHDAIERHDAMATFRLLNEVSPARARFSASIPAG
jgi:hypothetical protein